MGPIAGHFPRHEYVSICDHELLRRCLRHVSHGAVYLVGLFNGVWNSEQDAQTGLRAIKSDSFIGPRHRGAPIRYRLFYNHSGCSAGRGTCLEDLAETFAQRSAELDGLLARRWELFWEQVSGRAAAPESFTGLLSSRVLSSAHAFIEWRNALSDSILARITSLAGVACRSTNDARHRCACQ
jgi:hypothetical protein